VGPLTRVDRFGSDPELTQHRQHVEVVVLVDDAVVLPAQPHRRPGRHGGAGGRQDAGGGGQGAGVRAGPDDVQRGGVTGVDDPHDLAADVGERGLPPLQALQHGVDAVDAPPEPVSS
jgi:hypothetical protein